MKSGICLTVMLAAMVVFSCSRKSEHGDAGGYGEQHGNPKDWKFTLTQGDASEGRSVFIDLQCYKCHEVKGEKFPEMTPGDKGIGPELSHMAGMHTIEFFAESIINPNAVIDDDAKERGYIGEDGKSKMPEYGDVLTVKQLTDLATYLASLGGGAQKH